jgi:hypothetical protein
MAFSTLQAQLFDIPSNRTTPSQVLLQYRTADAWVPLTFAPLAGYTNLTAPPAHELAIPTYGRNSFTFVFYQTPGGTAPTFSADVYGSLSNLDHSWVKLNTTAQTATGKLSITGDFWNYILIDVTALSAGNLSVDFTAAHA